MKRKYTSLPWIEYPVATGNYSETGRKPITQIIIHSTVAPYASAINWFNNPRAGTSAHYIISNQGELAAMLEEYYVAYHAGNLDVNQRSIGIEHEWYQGLTPSDALYRTSAKLVADICKFYGFACNRGTVKGHKEIVATGCPNLIDVDRIVREAQAILTPPTTKPTYEQLEQKILDLQETEKRLKIEKDSALADAERNCQNKLKNRVEEIKNKVITLVNSL